MRFWASIAVRGESAKISCGKEKLGKSQVSHTADNNQRGISRNIVKTITGQKIDATRKPSNNKGKRRRETEVKSRQGGWVSGAADKVIATREWMRKFNYFRSLLFFQRPNDSSAFSSTVAHPRTLCKTKRKNFQLRAINWVRSLGCSRPRCTQLLRQLVQPCHLDCRVHCLPSWATWPTKCCKTFQQSLLLLL